ncbi:hypothetical protein VFDL14_16360 [Vibrio fortis]|uniref:Uncharacterized protein n=1 Tax=Vibrio fortis TaxID=212667 RepID=A0A066UQZ1_9VIBR|nr:hypothetical protein VFDL14_16360 [Vibrio fortis]
MVFVPTSKQIENARQFREKTCSEVCKQQSYDDQKARSPNDIFDNNQSTLIFGPLFERRFIKIAF